MKLQNWQQKTEDIRDRFVQLKKTSPNIKTKTLNLSWSNWGFGQEKLANSIKRLQQAGVKYIELHGNWYGEDLGYKVDEVKKILGDHDVQVGGICGMFTPDNDLSSNRGIVRQAAIDYIRRNVEFGASVGAKYFLIVPGAVGRPQAIDSYEFDRSVETLARVADVFTAAHIQGAVEPIRSAEVSFCHTFADAIKYIEALDHPGVQKINGDVYHMQSEEAHIASTLLQYGDRLVNLHMADSNRCALGQGSLDLDAIIMALYLIGYNNDSCFCTAEPLGPGGDPYPMMFGRQPKEILDELVQQSASYFYEREAALLSKN